MGQACSRCYGISRGFRKSGAGGRGHEDGIKDEVAILLALGGKVTKEFGEIQIAEVADSDQKEVVLEFESVSFSKNIAFGDAGGLFEL